MAMDSLFDRALAAARQLGASDIHLKPGMEPILRINGELRTLHDRDDHRLTNDFLHNLAMSLLNDRRRDILERQGDVTVALTTSAGMRQRVHISQHRRGMTISMHLVPMEAPALASLGLPAEARDLVAPGAGLGLVASGPGGGKTSTLAALIDEITTQPPGPRRHDRRSGRDHAEGPAWRGRAARGRAGRPVDRGRTARVGAPGRRRAAGQRDRRPRIGRARLDRRGDRTARARRRDGRPARPPPSRAWSACGTPRAAPPRARASPPSCAACCTSASCPRRAARDAPRRRSSPSAAAAATGA